jgi:hypothetical protein
VTAEVEETPATAKDICNGATGAPGTPGVDGQPWTPESKLPEGATETGAWAFNGTEDDTAGMVAPISFTVQLPEELFESEVHYQTDTGFADSCPGTASEPAADPGQLCVYFNSFGDIGTPFNATLEQITRLSEVRGPGERERSASRSGAALYFEFTGDPGEVAYGNGSWAVQAPEEP